VALEKLDFNTRYPKGKEVWRYIEATKSRNSKVRQWGLENLMELNESEAARYLKTLYEQSNFTLSKREFSSVKNAYFAHKEKYPHLYEDKQNKVVFDEKSQKPSLNETSPVSPFIF
jgi:hypothetical protein